MKTQLPVRFTKAGSLACLATALLLIGSLITQAQPNPDNPNRPRAPLNQRPPGDRPAPGMQPALGLALMERALNEAQRESLRSIMAAQREAMRGIQEKMRKARKELLKASLAEEFDEDLVRARALAVALLEADVTVLRAKAISQVQPPLSDEQIAEIMNPPQDQGPLDGGPRPNERRGDRQPRPRDGDNLPRPPRPDSQ